MFFPNTGANRHVEFTPFIHEQHNNMSMLIQTPQTWLYSNRNDYMLE